MAAAESLLKSSRASPPYVAPSAVMKKVFWIQLLMFFIPLLFVVVLLPLTLCPLILFPHPPSWLLPHSIVHSSSLSLSLPPVFPPPCSISSTARRRGNCCAAASAPATGHHQCCWPLTPAQLLSHHVSHNPLLSARSRDQGDYKRWSGAEWRPHALSTLQFRKERRRKRPGEEGQEDVRQKKRKNINYTVGLILLTWFSSEM